MAAAVAATAVSAAGAAKQKPLKGTITADGSSTVGPYATAAAEMFQKKHPGVRITVGISGTGGGFERFCKGETDLSDASRPIKQSNEAPACRQNGVRYVAFTVANDALTVVVNKSATWVDCLTTGELKKIWNTGSKVDNWADVRPGFPNVPLKLYGPGTDSGTFDYFTEVINGKSRASRSDYFASEDDNVLVQGVAGERGAMGYFGFSYYEENQGRLKALRIDNGGGCVAPSVQTAQNGTYKPLSRPLFIYAKRTSFKRAEVAAFIGFIFNNERTIAKRGGYVSLTDRQLKKARFQYRDALRRIFG
ncbi:MAG TPA: PstS family phosphate ABC transporter substrate-binding protein [Gaiellaceae bacterium]|nr:PstS family phosphate ABC transporter substrate-binding protein [Gaiellaceae bacterium]